MLVSQSVHHFGPDKNFSNTIGWTAMRVCAYSHDPKRITSNDLGDPLSFPLRPPAGQSFNLSCEITIYCMDWHKIWYMVPR